KGNQIKVIDDNHWGLADCPGILAALLGFGDSRSDDYSENVLVQLALAMRSHGRGALLLIVPEGSSAWLHSIVQPINYLVEPHYVVPAPDAALSRPDRKSTRLNSSHVKISYAVFCLKKKIHKNRK